MPVSDEQMPVEDDSREDAAAENTDETQKPSKEDEGNQNPTENDGEKPDTSEEPGNEPTTPENPDETETPNTPEENEENREPSDDPSTENGQPPENADLPDGGDTGSEDGADTDTAPDDAAEEEIPPAEEETPPADEENASFVDTVSENTVSENTVFAADVHTEIPTLEDFKIVDEGGNEITAEQIIRIKQKSEAKIPKPETRTLSLKPVPEDAEIPEDDVTWTVTEGSRVTVTPTKGKGKISLADTPENGSLSGTVTVSVKTGEEETAVITKTCQIEYLPEITGLQIVDQDGKEIPEAGITITPGQQKMLGVKLLPEGAVTTTAIRWRCGSYLRIQNGLLTVSRTPSKLPYTSSVSASITVSGETVEKECKVTIQAPEETEGIRMGDILFTCSGNMKYTKVDNTTWNADIDQNARTFTLTYKGNTTENYTIYYANSGKPIIIDKDRNRIGNATSYKEGRSQSLKQSNPLQVVLGIGQKGRQTFSDIYTVNFTTKKTDLRISPTLINNVPGGAPQEISVKLPEGCELKDVTWKSGDERIVKIEKNTEKGVMLTFGQTVGRTQITASVKAFDGKERYAVCNVNVSMKIPNPVFSSESGGKMSEEIYNKEDDTYDTNDYWLIDNGGKVTLSVRGLDKAKIYYTTNGADPLKSGKLYQSPITVNAKTTIKACAKMDGYTDSSVEESEFRIGNPKLTIPASVTLGQNAQEKAVTVKLPSGADISDLTWTSSDEDIAKAENRTEYDDEGNETKCTPTIIKGTKTGVCTLTASIEDYAYRTQTAVCRVTVTGKLTITPEITMKEGESAEIKITQGQGFRDNVTWTIGDSSIIQQDSVEANGNLKISAKTLKEGVGPQTTTVTATAEVGEETHTAVCLVTVTPEQYTVRFIGINENNPAKTELVYKGMDATPPETAVMENAAPKGYTFKGWKETDGWKRITKDTDIHANYTLDTYQITYVTDDKGSNPSGNPATYQVTSKNLPLKDATPANSSLHKFAGWYLNEQYEGSPIDEIAMGSAGNITLYAKWISAKTGLSIKQIDAQPYTGKAITPAVEVYDGDTLLTLGKDYTVSYKNNTKAYTKPWEDPKKAPTVTIKGKGNYNKFDTEAFEITPQSIANEETSVVIPDLYLAYTGKPLKVLPTVTWNGKKLKNKTDFEVTKIEKNASAVEEVVDAGEYTVTVTGKGNFTGTRDIRLTVTKKTLLSKASFKPRKLKDIPWTELNGKTLGGANIEPDEGVTLKYKGQDLKKGTDYTVTFNKNAKDAGIYEAVFTATATSDYEGTVVKTFKITGRPLSASKLDIDIKDLNKLTYNGAAQEPTLTISYKDGSNKLPMTLGTDYTLSWENNTNAGKKATVIITGKNGYTGTVKKTFQITPYSLKDGFGSTQKTVKIALADGKAYYEKGGAKPKVKVTYNDTVLTEGTDYTVRYTNNSKVAADDDPKKPPTITVTGKGNFKDKASITFSIEPQDIAALSITAEDIMAAAPNTKKGEKIGYTGAGKYKRTPKITDFNGKALKSGTDFDKKYTFTDENGVTLGSKDRLPEGSILTVTVQGIKNYHGETKVSYRVLAAKKSVAKARVALKKDVVKNYSTEPVTLKKEDLVVKLNGIELSGENYTIVSYINNRKKGTAKVTIQGVGEYGGTKTINFSIKPRELRRLKN